MIQVSLKLFDLDGNRENIEYDSDTFYSSPIFASIDTTIINQL